MGRFSVRHFGRKSCMYAMGIKKINFACNIYGNLYVCMLWRADFRKNVKKAETL